jgi:hypothetical protein
VDLLEGAFGGATKHPGNPGTQAAHDTSNLYHDIDTLKTDASYILAPCVSLAGCVGAAAWALGHRRGPSIVGGAVMAGVIGAGLSVIVQ